LGKYADRGTVSAIVMLAEVKVRNTKKGDKMAMLRVEDLTGQVDGVVFPKAFERLELLLQTDARLMVWGKVDRRDEAIQLIIEDAEAIDEVRIVMVELDVNTAKDIEHQHRLKQVLVQHRGEESKAKIPIVAIVKSAQQRHFVRLGAQFRVQDSEATVAALLQEKFEARSTTLLSG